MALNVVVDAEHEIRHLMQVVSAHIRDAARLVSINAGLEKLATEFQTEIEQLKARIAELEQPDLLAKAEREAEAAVRKVIPGPG